VYGQFFIPVSQLILRPVTYWFNIQDRNIKKFRSPILATQRIWPRNSTHNLKQTSSQLSYSEPANKSILDVRDKRKLTEELINLLPEEDRTSVSSAMHAWWFNIRRNGGMRLTGMGYRAFTEALDLEHYSYAIGNPLLFNQHIILKLDRKMQMPYYISATKGIPKKIIFFGSKEAVMVNLYGNLQQFLDNYTP
jgi:hypothetical protein